MRQRTLLTILYLISSTTFGQISVQLYFKDACSDSIIKPNFDLLHIDSIKSFSSTDGKVTVYEKGNYILTVSMWGKEYVGFFDQPIEIQTPDIFIDTISIPKIKMTSGAELHTKFWSYFNCNKPCNGREADFYENGQKRLEGNFVDGKPKWLVEYRVDGTKKEESWYTVGKYFPDKLSYYDEMGLLTTYEIRKVKKRKTITLTYDSTDKLLQRDLDRHYRDK